MSRKISNRVVLVTGLCFSSCGDSVRHHAQRAAFITIAAGRGLAERACAECRMMLAGRRFDFLLQSSSVRPEETQIPVRYGEITRQKTQRFKTNLQKTFKTIIYWRISEATYFYRVDFSFRTQLKSFLIPNQLDIGLFKIVTLKFPQFLIKD